MIWRNQVRWLVLTMALSFVGGCSSSPDMQGGALSKVGIGVIDTQQLLEKSRLGRQGADTLNNFMKDRQNLIALEQKELRDLENELLRQGSVLSPSAKKQREEQFRRRMMEYQQKVSNMNQEVQEKQNELFSEFRKAVEAVVEKVARKHGLILVVEKGPNTTTRYYDPALDISEEVLRGLDQEFR